LEVRIEDRSRAEQALWENYRKTTGLYSHAEVAEAVLAADAACPACGALAEPELCRCPDCGIKLA